MLRQRDHPFQVAYKLIVDNYSVIGEERGYIFQFILCFYNTQTFSSSTHIIYIHLYTQPNLFFFFFGTCACSHGCRGYNEGYV